MKAQPSNERLDPVDSIHTVDLSCWEDFEDAIKISFANPPVPTLIGHVSSLLFRGQRDAKWGLRTTLERNHKPNFAFKKYFNILSSTHSVVESYTERRFEFPNFDSYFDTLSKTKSPFHASMMPAYEYMVYLRHFGFPSPLLDWTESPYIAAYFAFVDASTSLDSRVAIYSYREWAGAGKIASPSEATILTAPNDTRAHKRHHLQQCKYTVCIHNNNDEWIYSQYKDAANAHNTNQDIIRKYTLPTSERAKVLQILNRYNINDFSLFESEESLMKTMAMKAFDFPPT